MITRSGRGTLQMRGDGQTLGLLTSREVGEILGGYWMWLERSRRDAALLGGSLAGVLVALVLPGLVLLGPAYWIDLGAEGPKTFATFRQHFAALVAPFQIAPGPNPWTTPEPYFERVFPRSASMLDVLRAPGLPYLDFVALSLARGVRKVGWVFQWGWLVALVLGALWWRSGLRLGAREKSLLLCAVGCVPFVLFAFPHIRYFARYYALFWILLAMVAERLAREGDPALRRPVLGLAGGLALLALAANARRAALGLAAAPQLHQYWFSD